jgi:hypothetical protein
MIRVIGLVREAAWEMMALVVLRYRYPAIVCGQGGYSDLSEPELMNWSSLHKCLDVRYKLQHLEVHLGVHVVYSSLACLGTVIDFVTGNPTRPEPSTFAWLQS